MAVDRDTATEAMRRYREIQVALVSFALRDLQAFWHDAPKDSAASLREALAAFLPGLVTMYGEAAAVAASEFYDDLRANSDAALAGIYFAEIGDDIPKGVLTTTASILTEPIAEIEQEQQDEQQQHHDEVMEAARKRTEFVTERFVIMRARNTIADNVAKDPARARYARVPSGSETCAFCLVLASRGAVYLNEDTALHRKYHYDCDCTAIPVWEGDEYPEGYDPDALYQKYADARSLHGYSNERLTGDDGLLAAVRQTLHSN